MGIANLSRPTAVLSLLLLLLVASFLLALFYGAVELTTAGLYSILVDPEGSGQLGIIFYQIRLPRVLLALLVGATLSICGALSQGLFRNPLADPSLIGVTAGASVGASVYILIGAEYQGGPFLGISMLSLAACLGGFLAVLLVYKLSFIDRSTSVANMLLIGIAVTAFASSITGLMEYFSDNEMLRRMSLWRMGGMEAANYQGVLLALMVLLLLIAGIPRYLTALNVLLLGEAESIHLGFDPKKTKFVLIVLIAVGTGCAVALGGTIAFIGLVVPHILRQIVGPNHHYLVPGSALGGAILLVMADTISRTIIAPVEIPVGLITALIGAPFFIYLLRNRYQYGVQ
jgi:iron complex transport system permease protein